MPRQRPTVIAAPRVVAPARDLVPGYLEVAGGIIIAVRAGTPRHARAIRFDGTLIPGLIDLQVNGAGVDFLTCRDASDVARAKLLLASGGVTAFLPTLISAPLMEMARAIGRWHEFAQDQHGPSVLGLHLEGPYLNPAYAGAHDPVMLRDPDPVECEAFLLKAVQPGFVRMMTIAPELPSALQTIRMIRSTGVVVALGHTAATAEEADAAFDAGATMVTHLFNAMRPVHHRDPGIVVAALRRSDVVVSLIADFIHLHPAIVALIVAVKGWRRSALISDAIAAQGAGSGEAALGSRMVDVTDAPRLPDGTLAGSTLTLAGAVANTVSVGVPLRQAVAMASTVPAAVLGLRDRGRLAAGTRADFVVLDDMLRPSATFVNGIQVHPR